MSNLREIIPAFFTGPQGQRLTPEQIQAREVIAADMLSQATDTSPNAGGTASIVAKALMGLSAGRNRTSAERAGQANAAASAENMSALTGGIGQGWSMPEASAAPTVASGLIAPAGTNAGVMPVSSAPLPSVSGLPESFFNGVDATEGGGDYGTLFGNSQQGRFSGIDITQMPISDVLAFADPSGEYGQWVKGQVGHVATPLGRHQIVGSTLKRAVESMGIDPSMPFSQDVQDSVALHLAQNRIRSSPDMKGKINALRSEWEGFKNLPDDQVAAIVNDIEGSGTGRGGGVVDYLKYANQNATRSLPVSDRLSSALSFLPELGVTAEVFSGGQPAKGTSNQRVGSTRHDHGDAADVRFYRNDGTLLDWSNEQDRPIFEQIVQRGRQAGLTGFGAGPGYMQQGSIHIGFGEPGVWGAGGKSANAPEWLVNAYNSQPASLPQGGLPQGATYTPAPAPNPVAQALTMPPIPSVPPLDPRVQQTLASPYATREEKSVAAGLLQQHQSQVQAAQQQYQQRQMAEYEQAVAQQQAAQALAQRQQIAGQMGINPAFAADEIAFKAMVDQATRDPASYSAGSYVMGRDGNLTQIPEASTTDMRNYDAYAADELRAGREPLSRLEFAKTLKSSGAQKTEVNVNGGEKFDDEFAKLDAQSLNLVSQSGMAAQRNIPRIDRLESLLSGVPTGAEANFKQIAANWGLKLGDDVDQIQAAQALINSMVPEQRPAGSGPMSDADLELFKQSLPRIINTPGGNKLIIDTMRAIAQYDAQGAEIVQRLRNGEINRTQAFQELQSRENPLSGLDGMINGSGNQPSSSVPPPPANANQDLLDVWDIMTPEERAKFQ